MMKQILMFVFVMISCSAFAQDVVTNGNREYAGFNLETYDNSYATAYDKDPPSNSVNIDPDADPIVDSKSRTSATNKDNGVHRRTAQSRVKCYSDEYKGHWGVGADTPQETIEKPDGAGHFEGVFSAHARVNGEVLGVFDCRRSIHRSTAGGSITAWKKNESGSQLVGANSFIPWKHNPDGIPDPPPQRGISPNDPNQTPQPGDSVTLNLVTSEPYYYVSWYVKAPWDTSERGTYIDGDNGDGTLTEASVTYSFPSGVMNTGDFLFTASISRYADMSWYGDETHTVSVSMPTVPSRPVSFSLTAGRISIRLNWTSSASDGGSAIEAYEFQYQSSTNDRRRWSSWSTWESGGTDNFHLIQGLSRDTDYAVRMRARNSVGTSIVTGIRIIKTLR